MARYKDVHYDQDKFIPISFQKQILPGTFEYTLYCLIDHRIVHGEAFGEAQEHVLLKPVIQSTEEHFQAIGHENIFKSTKLTADSGFYNTVNVTHLYEQGIDGYLPDLGFRKRDPRFADVEHYRARSKQERRKYLYSGTCVAHWD